MLDKFFRELPSFKGKRRLATSLFSKKISDSKNILIEGKNSCKYHLPNLKETVGFEIFVNGIYESDTIDLLSRLIPPKGHLIDVGANIGAILVPLCSSRKDIHAIGIEAAPWIFDYLNKNVSINNIRNVRLFNNALFDKDGVEIDFYSPSEKFGKGSLSPVFSQTAIKVTSVTLDSIVKENNMQYVDAVKIDVEGFEYFVFKGASTLLSSERAPHLVFEFVDWAEQQAMGLRPGAAQEYLLNIGYELFVIQGKKLVKLDNILQSGSYNLLASKRM